MSPHASTESSVNPWSPEWVRDLVIYVVATKAFTSPDGPESGTFDALAGRFPYLRSLGITGIWLTGHSLSHPTHFFNAWTQYACIRPDVIDPSLGGVERFRAMVAAAHDHGIRIFLDVIHHGVMPESSLIAEHPDWFRGGTWGMVDYDWGGGHTDLDDWWVDLWTRAVVEDGVDGFRIDLGMHGRTDLWARIRRNAEAAGRSIVIFEEGDRVVPGVSDFCQGASRISSPGRPDELDPVLVGDVPGYYARRFGKAGRYDVEIAYEDGSVARGSTDGGGELVVRLDGLVEDRVSAVTQDFAGVDDIDMGPSRSAPGVRRADGIDDVALTVSTGRALPIRSVRVSNDLGFHGIASESVQTWSTRGQDAAARPLAMDGATRASTLFAAGSTGGGEVRLFLATNNHGSTIELSAHDNGWWEDDENPFAARGSRSLFGYSCLFLPRVPLFMSGEEFDADFHPLPGLSVDTVGHANKGKGHILLGAMLDWAELDEPRHAAMLRDVTRMLALRRAHPGLLPPEARGDVEPRLTRVPHRSTADVPVPYARWSGTAAVVVVANRSDEPVDVILDVPIGEFGWAPAARYRVTDLWNDGEPSVLDAASLRELDWRVGPDRTPAGGIGLIGIEPA